MYIILVITPKREKPKESYISINQRLAIGELSSGDTIN